MVLLLAELTRCTPPHARAAVKECDHGLIMESGRDQIVQVPRSCDGSVRAAHPLAISPWATLKLYTLAA